jgi:predicted nucleic acid-binding protein
MAVEAQGAAIQTASRTVVVDASLAFKCVLTEPDSAIAQRMLSDWQASGVRMIAPTLLAADVANAIYKRVRANQLTPAADASLALGALLTTEIAYDADPNLEPSGSRAGAPLRTARRV